MLVRDFVFARVVHNFVQYPNIIVVIVKIHTNIYLLLTTVIIIIIIIEYI